ncbi:uncharacterized protein LOC121855776 [Homarus americanus]|uniref:uncharacterized protein LOC121855776 n=1 Tax=Homarus americanus TaxID=6706 RepID=UPI001C45C2C2|nr:uncharacterized protein LOC121855776 [Homarus americanus]
MTSNAIRGIRRKKSSLSEVKIAVLGAPGVGKSALIVRFSLRASGIRSSSRTVKPLRQTPSGGPDGFLLVYSITDRQSFNWVKKMRLTSARGRPVGEED